MADKVLQPIVAWLFDMFMRNIEKFVENIAKEVREQRKSGKIQEYLDMIENPLVKVAATAIMEAIETYLDSLDIEDIVNLT